MTEALVKAGVPPSEVDYLEAHAVGAQLGDPIELNAVAAVYGKERHPQRPLLIGSVKSNIGHIEWAAGIAALIKTVLCINKKVIPKSLHLQTPNPNVEWDRIPVRVTSGRTDWPTVSGRLPLAGVNAFGLSGTNAHVVVEGYRPSTGANGAGLPAGDPKPIPVSLPEPLDGLTISGQGPPARTTRILPLSGKSEGALRELAKGYLQWLAGEEGVASDAALSDLAWTAAVGRSHFPHRCGLVFGDAEQLRERLRVLAGADAAPRLQTPRKPTRVAFAYPGQVSRWVGMAEALYRSEPVARAVLDRCDELIRQHREVSLLDVMFGHPRVNQNPNDPVWVGPAAYALGCALTAQWSSVGVRPSAVVGHGPGALAAAQAAGGLTFEEGLKLAATLGSPGETSWERDGPDPLEGAEAVRGEVTVTAPSVALVSNATGRLVESGGAFDVDHWLRQAEEPVDSSGCAATLARLGVDAIVEIGPDPVGRVIGAAWPEDTTAPAVIPTPVMSGDGESPEPTGGFLRAVAGAFEAGLDVSLAGLFAGEARRRISIPTYAFQRRRHWI